MTFSFQLEVDRLKKYIDILSKSLKSKSDELEQKKQTINKMIEQNLNLPLPPPPPPDQAGVDVEDLELDIDCLLQANLGAVNITDFLNLSGSGNNLADFSVLEAELGGEKVTCYKRNVQHCLTLSLTRSLSVVHCLRGERSWRTEWRTGP